MTAIKKKFISHDMTTDEELLSGLNSIKAKVVFPCAMGDAANSDVAYTSTGIKLIWVHSRNGSYKNAVLIANVIYQDRGLDIRVFDTVNVTVLGELTGVTSSGTIVIPLTLPSSNTVIELQIKKSSKGGKSPVVETAQYEFDTN